MWGLFAPFIVLLLLLASWRLGVAFIAWIIALGSIPPAFAGLVDVLPAKDVPMAFPLPVTLVLTGIAIASVWTVVAIAKREEG